MFHTNVERSIEKNECKSVMSSIGIILTYHIICHMVAISACNKDNFRCRKFIKTMVSFLHIPFIHKTGALRSIENEENREELLTA